jgi:hypothetical protein
MIVVTSYYPLSKSKHSLSEYRQWYTNFFQCVTADVVCFCPQSMYDEFTRLAKPNHTIIIREFDSFEMMSPEYMTIWNQWHLVDPERHVHSPELYAIWAAKQEFVLNAMNIKDASIYVWCDIGCFRHIRDGSFKDTYKYVQPGKITGLHIPYYNFIGGGVLAGDKGAWNMFSTLYKEELKRSPHGKDQIIFRRILNETNSNIINIDNVFMSIGDNAWFYLTLLFSAVNLHD